MLLVVNGDSMTAAGEAVNDFCFAQDDSKYFRLGRVPHPDNLAVSWGKRLSDILHCDFVCLAESASSNSRIIRTTLDYLNKNPKPTCLIIGWSTWERTEWYHEPTDCYYQINAAGVGEDWPLEIKLQYREWILSLDYTKSKQTQVRQVHDLHALLEQQQIPHVFFNAYESLDATDPLQQHDWHGCYYNAYDPKFTFFNWCQQQGFATTKLNGYHYGADAHTAWADHIFDVLVSKYLTSTT